MIKRPLVTALFLMALAPPALAARDVPGQIYDIGGTKLHMNCMGTGGPTVVFDAGLGGFSLEWLRIQRQLRDTVQSCAYDRAGYGWSEMGPSPRSTSQINDEFERLLEAAELQPPYILVGHSFGGYNVQYYAKSHPDRVAGVVLIDASHPEQAERIPEVKVRKARAGRPQMVTYFRDTAIFEKYPADVREIVRRIVGSRKSMITQRRELANFGFSGSEVDFLGDTFPAVPLTVISRGQQEWSAHPLGNAREKVWRKMQQELAELSPRGRQIQAENSGHMVHLDQPGLVVDAIQQMVRQCNLSDQRMSC